VTVPVVSVGTVRVLVSKRFVTMRVAVLHTDFGVVRMVVMAIVVSVGVLVLDALVRMPMLVLLGHV